VHQTLTGWKSSFKASTFLLPLLACELFHSGLGPLSAQPAKTEPRSLAQTMGFYHWAGVHTTSINQGIEEIARIGGRIARITLSARYRQDYNKDGPSCLPGFSLAGALRDDVDLRTALNNPRIQVYMLTVFDGVSYNDCSSPHALNPRFYTTSNTEAMEREYSDFVFSLHQLFAGTGKQFILANWEGDNAVYCGSAYNYAFLEDFRRYCDSNYPAVYLGNSGPAESLQGMIKWMRARSAGVANGKRRGADAGFPELEVLLAPEIVCVRMLRDRGIPSVLYDVIPFVNHDFVSYSAYESLRDQDVATRLAADLETIKTVSNGSRIIIGEAGFARSVWGNTVLPRTVELYTAAIKWGVSYIVHWNVFDQEINNDFGLFDSTGGMTELGMHFQRVLEAAPAASLAATY